MNETEHINLKEELLLIMDAIHGICVNNGIDYYIIGGTALGAIRHKGFIPWDIDMDIAMKRTDYERFIEIAPNKLNERFELVYFGNAKEYYKPNAIVISRNTSIEWNPKLYKKRDSLPIHIDVMPLDNVPKDRDLQIKQANRIKLKRRYQKYREFICYKKNSPMVCAIKYIFSRILRIVDNYTFNNSLDELMKKYCSSTSGKICSMASHYSYDKQCMDVSVYGKPRLYAFENREYFGPERMHDYLTKIFGDYNQLPPESEREAYMNVIESVTFDKRQ